jgi:hypothetical protein
MLSIDRVASDYPGVKKSFSILTEAKCFMV